MKFVKTQKPGLVENRCGGERDHVAVGDLAARDILAKAVNPLMHLGHEFVEVRAALVHDRTLLKKQIHQHGLAAPDFAVNVEAARRPAILVGEQPAQQTVLAQWLILRKPLFKSGKRLDNLGLRGIGLDRAGGDEGLVMGAERGGWRRQHGPPYGPNMAKIASRELVQGLCASGRFGGAAPRPVPSYPRKRASSTARLLDSITGASGILGRPVKPGDDSCECGP